MGKIKVGRLLVVIKKKRWFHFGKETRKTRKEQLEKNLEGFVSWPRCELWVLTVCLIVHIDMRI